MSIMSTLHFWGHTYLQVRKTDATRQRRDEPVRRHHTTAHLWLWQVVADAVPTPGSNITSRLETHCEVLQKARGHLPQSGTDGKVMRSTENLSFLIIGQTRGSGTWTTSRTSTSTTMLARAERTICESASFTKFLTRASRTIMAKTSVPRSEKRNFQIWSTGEEHVTHIQASDWKREQKRLDPSQQQYLEWLSMNWAENFEEQHNSVCTSSSSWSPSSTWWSSSEVGRNGTHTGGMTTHGQVNSKERQHRRYSTSTVEPSWHLRSFTLFLACLWGHNFQLSNCAKFFFF